MKILRNILDRTKQIIEKNPLLKKLYPIYEATDEIFFGTDKTARFAPFISDAIDVKRYMSLVIVALLPAVAASIYFYGIRVIAIIIVSYTFGGITEVIFSIIRKKPIYEGFLVTGLIFPLVLPPTIPLWIVAVGIVFGVLFGKEMFGGTGKNIFNPALVGRLFITIAFPSIMTTSWQMPSIQPILTWAGSPDAITSATPLVLYKSSQMISPLVDLLLGRTAGCIGETFRMGLILGGLFLLLTRVSNWRIPLSYIGTVFIFSSIGTHFVPAHIAPPLFQMLSGGLMLGALFMATDPVTTPFTITGKFIFGIGCGIFTVLIRAFSGYVEGVMFSIILMNAFSPLIDHMVLKLKYRTS